MTFQLTVYGTPQPAGSKRAVVVKGRARVFDDSRKSRPWKTEIQQAVGRALNGQGIMEGPLRAVFTFYVRRPKGHFGARGLKASAPPYPTTRPDVLKLARAVEDAMSGLIYRDDSQIVVEELRKYYGHPERVHIEVTRLSGDVTEEAA